MAFQKSCSALLFCKRLDAACSTAKCPLSPGLFSIVPDRKKRGSHRKSSSFPQRWHEHVCEASQRIYRTLLRNLSRRPHANSTRRNEWQTELLKTMWEGLRNVLPFKIYRLQMRAVCLKIWLPRNVRAVSVDKKGPFWGEKMLCVLVIVLRNH